MTSERWAMPDAAALDGLRKRDRAIVVSALAAVTALAWAYMLHMASGAACMTMAHGAPWRGWDLALAFAMWAVMMVAMMLPSATPMVLAFTALDRGTHETLLGRTSLFVVGYLAVWAAYSVLATLAQWALHAAALLSHAMATTSPLLGAGLLVTAGLFQFSPLRNACMSRCRSPVGFLLAEWRPGRRGAFVMGLRHGAYCVGCCWVLMSLSLVLGVMNLVWMAALTAFMLLEKAAPAGERISRVAGVVLVGWGAYVAVRHLL